MKNRFVRVEEDVVINVYVDTETGIEYALYHGSDKGGLTVILNPDGTPRINKDYF